MNENLIEEIVSDCGYEALGLYEYLYSIRDKKYDVTITSMCQIALKGDYFDTQTLFESIDELIRIGHSNIVFMPDKLLTVAEENNEFLAWMA